MGGHEARHGQHPHRNRARSRGRASADRESRRHEHGRGREGRHRQVPGHRLPELAVRRPGLRHGQKRRPAEWLGGEEDASEGEERCARGQAQSEHEAPPRLPEISPRPGIEAEPGQERESQRDQDHGLLREAQNGEGGEEPDDRGLDDRVATQSDQDREDGDPGQEDRVPGPAQEGCPGQCQGGQADVHRLEEGLPAFEEPLTPLPLEGQVHDEQGQAQLQQGKRMQGPVLLGGGGEAPAHRAPRHLERGHPERGRRAQPQGHGGEGRTGHAEAGHRPAGSRAEVSCDEDGGDERGHGGHVGGAGEHLEPGQQPPAEHVPRPSAGARGLLRGLQHPRHPGGPRKVVPHVGQGYEGPGQHPQGRRHERPASLGSQQAGQAEEAGAGQHEMHEDEDRVARREGQDQVEPREGVEHLGVGLGQHRLPERHPGVPDRPAAGGHRPDEGLDLGEPVGEDVALEEHAPEDEGEEGEERERDEGQRGASGLVPRAKGGHEGRAGGGSQRGPAAGETRSSTNVFHSWQWGQRHSMSSAR